MAGEPNIMERIKEEEWERDAERCVLLGIKCNLFEGGAEDGVES